MIVNGEIVALGPGGLDSWDPRKWKGLLRRGIPRIPSQTNNLALAEKKDS